MRSPEPKPVYDPDEKKPPTYYKSDLSNGPELALTKADHDRLVEGKGRPITQDGIGYYRKSSGSLGSIPDESTFVPRSES
jgi:hypothetical protein